VVSALFGSAAVAQERQPNIVYIVADDLGYGDLKPFYPAAVPVTPSLDQLAKDGTKFTEFYAGAAICTPSRAAMMMGQYAPRNGFGPALLPTSTAGIDASDITIAERLRAAGYATGLVGKWHLGNLPQFNPTRHGFDEFFGFPHGPALAVPITSLKYMRGETLLPDPVTLAGITPRFTTEAVKFINAHKSEPFFLEVAYSDPHVPWSEPTYRAVIQKIDKSVGQIEAAIKAAGLDSNTLMIFTSDNGADVLHDGGSCGGLKGAKNSISECGTVVPFIVRWPGHVPANRIVTAPAMNVDLFPTFSALADIALPDRIMDGEDISGAFLGTSKRQGNTFAFHHMGRLRGWRDGDFIVYYDRVTGLGTTMFNLVADPLQKTNLAKTQVAKFNAMVAAGRAFNNTIPVVPMKQ
jgi:arylsulfatase A-like enzyme